MTASKDERRFFSRITAFYFLKNKNGDILLRRPLVNGKPAMAKQSKNLRLRETTARFASLRVTRGGGLRGRKS